MRFFTTAHCESRRHCKACRASDPAWRESLRDHGLVDVAEFDCPHGFTTDNLPTVEYVKVAMEAQVSEITKRGREAWRVLHTEAMAEGITHVWLQKTFRSMIPRYGCTCLREWDEILHRNPLRLNDQFAWSIAVHNAVNLKLGKPMLTLDEAMALY